MKNIFNKIRVKIWIGNNKPFLDEELFKSLRTEESYWVVEGDELQVLLGKVLKADLWTAVFKSIIISPKTLILIKKNQNLKIINLRTQGT